MATRTEEEKRFNKKDVSIGQSLANNFLQNRNLLASFENKEADLWAGGGEHLSTSKLSSMLNSMQGRLKELPPAESHDDERLWSLRSDSVDSLDVSEMDSVVFGHLPTDTSESPLVFNYHDSISGSPGGPNRELRSVPRSISYSRQSEDDNDSLSSVSTTSSASRLHRNNRRAKLNAQLSTVSSTQSNLLKISRSRLQSDPDSDYISDAASVTSIESHGAVQRIRPPKEQAVSPVASMSSLLVKTEPTEVVFTPQKLASPKAAQEMSPAAPAEPKRRYNPFTEALKSQIPGRDSRSSMQRGRATQIENNMTTSQTESVPVALSTPTEDQQSHHHGESSRPQPRTPTGIPRAVPSSSMLSSQQDFPPSPEKQQPQQSRTLDLYPMKDIMTRRYRVVNDTQSSSNAPTAPESPPAYDATPSRSYARASPAVAAVEIPTTNSANSDAPIRPARMTASSLAQNPVVAQLLNSKVDHGRPRARTPTGTFGRSGRLGGSSIPPAIDTSVEAPEPPASPMVEHTERGRLRLRSTSTPRGNSGNSSNSGPVSGGFSLTPSGTRSGRSPSRGAGPTTPTPTASSRTEPAVVGATKWQQPLSKGRTGSNNTTQIHAHSKDPPRTRSSFGSTVSAPAYTIPLIKSPPNRSSLGSSTSSLSSRSSLGPQRAKSPASGTTRAKSPGPTARSKSPVATARAKSPSATVNRLTIKGAANLPGPSVGPAWQSSSRTPSKVNTNVVQVPLPSKSPHGSSASSVSSSGSGNRSTTPTSTSGNHSSRLHAPAEKGVSSQFSPNSVVQLKSSNLHPLRKVPSPCASPGGAVSPNGSSNAFFPATPPNSTPAPAVNRRMSEGGAPKNVTGFKLSTSNRGAHSSHKPESSAKPRSSYPGGISRVATQGSTPTAPSSSESVCAWTPPPEAIVFASSSSPQLFMQPMAHLGQESISGVYDSLNYNPSPAFFLRSPRAASKYNAQRAAEAQRDRERLQQQEQWRSEASTTLTVCVEGSSKDEGDQGSGRTDTTNTTNATNFTNPSGSDFLPTEGIFEVDESGDLSESPRSVES